MSMSSVKLSDSQFKEWMDVQKHTPASTTLDAATLHGPFPESANQFGIYSRPGVRPGRYSTLTRPDSLVNILGINPSFYTDEILEINTGVTAAAGTNATSACGDPPVAGQAKVCQQIYRFGRYHMKTRLNALPEIGQLRNRADVPAEILNAGPTGNPLVPDLMYRLDDPRSQLQYELWLLGVEFERTLDLLLVQGTAAAAANAHLGWSVEFDGLDQLVTTGHTDAVTGITCPAMDSAIVTYSANVNTTTADGRNIVQVMADQMYGLRTRADKMGMGNTQWVILMRREAYRAFAEQYACTYNLFRCTGSQYEETNQDALQVNQFRLAMQTGQYIEVEGIRYPVIVSEGIPQTTPAANTMESDMYILPVSANGAPLLRLEYYPMDNQYTTEFTQFAGTEVITMNNGMWMAGERSTGLCEEYHFLNKFRLVLEAPWLAGRVDNLQYSFFAPIRNAIPDSSFYEDGGVSIATWPGIAVTA